MLIDFRAVNVKVLLGLVERFNAQVSGAATGGERGSVVSGLVKPRLRAREVRPQLLPYGREWSMFRVARISLAGVRSPVRLILRGPSRKPT